MSKLFISTALVFLCAFAAFSQPAKCKKFDSHGKPKCGGAKSWKTCPENGVGGDPLLNQAKNRIDLAANPDQLKIIDIANFTHPKSWASGTPRDKLVEWGEGREIQVALYLKEVKNYTQGAEACNCNIDGDKNNDYHLVLVSTKNSKEKNSLTAEISPRVRRDNWTYSKLKALAKDKTYVRVTGWAMLDTQHVGSSVPVRRTHWEIHPVTEFEICTSTKSECNAGSGWIKLEDMP